MFIIKAIAGRLIAMVLISAVTTLYGWVWPSPPAPDVETRKKFEAIVQRTRHEIEKAEAKRTTGEHRRPLQGLRQARQL